MHSSLPQQLENFAFSRSSLLRWMFRGARADGDQAIARHDRDLPASAGDGEERSCPERTRCSSKTRLARATHPSRGAGARFAHRSGWMPTAPMVLYTGTFEAYQGLRSAVCAAARIVRRERPDVRFVLAGGKPDQVAKARAQAAAMGAEGIIFTGEQPSESIPGYLDAADVLVSPRSSGTNTPLKIYQYLRSGRVIVATRLLTHTQVLSDDVAISDRSPTPEDFAQGDSARDRRSRSGRAHRPRRQAACGHTLHLRSLSAANPRSVRRSGGDEIGIRITTATAAYADPAMASSFDAKRFGGPIGRILLDDQERVLVGVSRRRVWTADSRSRHGHRTRGDRARQTRCGGHRCRRVERDVERRAREHGRRRPGRSNSSKATRTGWQFPDRAFDSRGLPAAAHARAGLAKGHCRAVPRDRAPARVRLSGHREAPLRCRRSGDRAASHAGQHGRGVSGIPPRHRSAASSSATAFASTHTHKQFVLPIGFHKLVGSTGFTRSVERFLARAGLLRLAGSPVTIAAERCAS